MLPLVFARLFLCTALFLSVSVFLNASNGYNPRKYICYRTSSPLVIDGKFDEPDWQAPSWSENFVDVEGEKKSKPDFLTQVRMLWDENYFYIGAKLYEQDIWAEVTQRDGLVVQDNAFEVFIDPDGDTHMYFEVSINALGTVRDMLLIKPYRDGGPALRDWNIPRLNKGIHIQGTLNDTDDEDLYWNVELGIPWEALNIGRGSPVPKSGSQWRVNFCRVNWQTKIRDGKYEKETEIGSEMVLPAHNWVWSPQGVVSMHQPETWGFVQFSRHPPGAKQARWLEDVDDSIKWFLRHIYYEQAELYRKTGAFAEDLKMLRSVRVLSREEMAKMKMKTGFSQYEVHYLAGSRVIKINQEGKVWSEMSR